MSYFNRYNSNFVIPAKCLDMKTDVVRRLPCMQFHEFVLTRHDAWYQQSVLIKIRLGKHWAY